MNKIKQSILSIVIGLALAGGISFAWTGPTVNPPGENTPAPINVSGNNQTFDSSKKLSVKDSSGVVGAGILSISGGLNVNGLAIFDGNVGVGTVSPKQKLDVEGGFVRGSVGLCIGDDCRMNWPDSTSTKTEVVAITTGTATITYRDYSGDHESCNVSFTSSFCNLSNIQSPVQGHWDEELCKGWFRSAIQDYNYCPALGDMVLRVNWNIDGGPVDIAYIPRVVKISTGTATITGRDYSGDHESCNVSFASSFCNLSDIQSPVHGHWDDGLCKGWLEDRIKNGRFCPALGYRVLSADWRLSGDSGPVDIQHIPPAE